MMRRFLLATLLVLASIDIYLGGTWDGTDKLFSRGWIRDIP